jgi:hypothetical protein
MKNTVLNHIYVQTRLFHGILWRKKLPNLGFQKIARTMRLLKPDVGNHNYGELMDEEILKAIEGIVRVIAPPLISVAGVWIGWRLGTHSQWKQRRLDNLLSRLAALREVMSVTDNIPSNLDFTGLKLKIANDPEFYKNLNYRLIRLFGLRTELTPYLEPEIRKFIDYSFRPLFDIGVGSYKLLPDKEDKFAHAAIELRRITNSVEEKLIKEHEILAG